MAKTGFVGTTFVDASGRRRATKFGWSKGELSKLLGPGTAIALQKAALLVRREAQRQIVGGRGGRKPLGPDRGQFWRVGEKDGYPVVAYVRYVPRENKLSSWRPSAFLRNDIEAQFDRKTTSVVIGPSKWPWLNQLHEFGGSVNVFVQHTKYPVKEYGGRKVPQKYQAKSGRTYRGAYVGVFNNNYGNFIVGPREVKKRPYMKPGFEKAKPDIPAQFRNMLGYKK
jgi:hypothetical protein